MKLSQLLLIGVLITALPMASQAAEIAVAPAAEAAAATPADAVLTNGIIKRIDAEQGKLTISHEALQNLGMPAMTMIFRVADPAMITKVKTGDPVKFRAEKANGALTVVRIEPAV